MKRRKHEPDLLSSRPRKINFKLLYRQKNELF